MSTPTYTTTFTSLSKEVLEEIGNKVSLEIDVTKYVDFMSEDTDEQIKEYQGDKAKT